MIEAEKIMTSQSVYQSVNQPPAASLGRPKALPRGFRFTAPQKAYLQNEVTQNGSSPDAERREKMAKELGVEEKTIKVRIVRLPCIFCADVFLELVQSLSMPRE